jgi:hypothetical protein
VNGSTRKENPRNDRGERVASSVPVFPLHVPLSKVLGPDGETLYNLLRFDAALATPYYWGNLAVLLR